MRNLKLKKAVEEEKEKKKKSVYFMHGKLAYAMQSLNLKEEENWSKTQAEELVYSMQRKFVCSVPCTA